MDNETTQKDISDKIKKATKNLNQYIFKAKKWDSPLKSQVTLI